MSQSHYKTMKDKSKKQRTEALIQSLVSECGRLNKIVIQEKKYVKILRALLWGCFGVLIIFGYLVYMKQGFLFWQ